MSRQDALLLFTVGLLTRLPLVLAYPGIHGGDSVARLANSHTLVLAYQLPLPQLLVFAARGVDPDPLWTRLVFVLIGSLAPVAMAAAVAAGASGSAGRAAGVLLALHPLIAYYSLVPYQESPMLLFLLAGAAALLRGRDGIAAIALGLACLCRYEAWIAAGLAVIARRKRPARALLLFGSAPALWVLAWQGLSPAGTYVLDLDPAAGRLARLPFLLDKLREYSGDLLIAISLPGAVLALRRPGAFRWGAAYVVLFLASVVAAGHEFPPGSGRVSERLAHVPAAALCALAGLALGAALDAGAASSRSVRALAVTALLAWQALSWSRRTEALVAEANRDPSLRLAVEVARLANGRLAPGERLAVAAPAVQAAAIEDYVRKVEASGGDSERARGVGRELARHSPDAGRIAAHLARPPGTVVAYGAPAQLLAVFDEATDGVVLPPGAPIARFTAGARGVAVYRAP
jgi:hypothetical protein